MNFFNGFTVKLRLATIAILGLFFVFLVGTIGYINVSSVSQRLSSMYADNLVPIGDIGNANMQAVFHNRALLEYVIENRTAEMERISLRMTEYERKMKEHLQSFRDGKNSEKEISLLENFDKSWTSYSKSASKVKFLSFTDKKLEAMEEFNGVTRKLFQTSDDLLLDLYQAKIVMGRSNDIEGQSSTDKAKFFALGIMAISIVSMVTVSALISKSITSSLGAEPQVISEVVLKIANGDLSKPLPFPVDTEHHVLANLARMQWKLTELVHKIREDASVVLHTSREVAQGNVHLSSRTEEQASSLEQTASSMDKLGASAKLNSANVDKANGLSETAKAIAAEGATTVTDVMVTMEKINQSSQKVNEIIAVIEGIAFQTNILALNAAVEAARAGEQGRGFAVVASEVRGLAIRSAAAAKDVKSLINESVSKVQNGKALVDTAGATMVRLENSVQEVHAIMNEIRVASMEQSEGVEQIGIAVEQLDQVTQHNAALVEEISSSAKSLETRANSLVESVRNFTLES